MTIATGGVGAGLIGVVAGPSASTATVTVHADCNVIVGTGGVEGAILTDGNVVVTAGTSTNVGNIVVDEDGVIAGFGTGTIMVTATGNITLQQTGGITGAVIKSEGDGVVTLTTGAGGTFTADSGTGGGVDSDGGNITVTADDMFINTQVTPEPAMSPC